MHLKEVANFGPKLTTFRPQDPKPLAKPFKAKAKPLAKPFKAKAKAKAKVIGKAIQSHSKPKPSQSQSQGFAKIHPIKEATFPLQFIPPSGINLSHGSLMTE